MVAWSPVVFLLFCERVGVRRISERRWEAVVLAEDELSEVERRVVAAARTGSPVDLAVGDPDLDNPADGAAWGHQRSVRGELLCELLSGVGQLGQGQARQLRLRGARVVGSFDLEAKVVTGRILLRDCYLDQPVCLNDAEIQEVRLPGCHVAGIEASRVHIRGNLELDKGFTAIGSVHLWGARIAGRLDLSGADLTGDVGEPALQADGLVVDRGMFCRDGFAAQGEVRLPDARITGPLDLDGARLTGRQGRALAADGLLVDGGLFCRGMITSGEVRLIDARITGPLHVDNARFANPGGDALTADGLTVGRSMTCERLAAEGEVRISGADIGAQLVFDGAVLTNPGRTALAADGLTVGQGMFCAELHAFGMLRLVGARINGPLGFPAARLINPDGLALVCDGIIADGGIFCRGGFAARGAVRFVGARVGGPVELEGAFLSNPGADALAADTITVDHNVTCTGMSVQGAVRFAGARVKQRLDLREAILENPGDVALDLEGAEAAALNLLTRQRPQGTVILANMRVGSFHDDQVTWPAVLRLDGFVYETLENASIDVRGRLLWLARNQAGYVPQLYEQLAATYRKHGHEEAGRRVAIAKQWGRRAQLNPPGKAWNWLLYLTVGYGYRTWLAVVWLIVLTAIGSLIFGQSYPAHMVAATTPAPAFHPIAYSLDVLLPIVDLGQQTAWLPQGAALYWSWALAGAGWVLTTAFVAGLTKVLRRE